MVLGRLVFRAPEEQGAHGAFGLWFVQAGKSARQPNHLFSKGTVIAGQALVRRYVLQACFEWEDAGDAETERAS